MANRMLFWDKEFINSDNLLAKITTTTKEVKDRIYFLEEKVQSSSYSLEEIIEDCYQIVCRVPIFLFEMNLPTVVRCRPDDLSGRVVNVSEMSYNPRIELAKTGRFNLEKEPIFYAVSPSENKEGFPIELAAIFETCKELRDQNYVSVEDKIITISYWGITKPFWCVFFPFHDEANSKNISLKGLSKYFEEAIKRKFYADSQETLVFLNNYFSKKASAIKGNTKDYIITSAFKHGLERYYGNKINAILYPSAMSDNHCLNIAIERRMIDDGYLKFDWARMYKISTNKRIVPISERAYADENDNVTFTLIKK
jgi:hypothetical protein